MLQYELASSAITPKDEAPAFEYETASFETADQSEQRSGVAVLYGNWTARHYGVTNAPAPRAG